MGLVNRLLLALALGALGCANAARAHALELFADWSAREVFVGEPLGLEVTLRDARAPVRSLRVRCPPGWRVQARGAPQQRWRFAAGRRHAELRWRFVLEPPAGFAGEAKLGPVELELEGRGGPPLALPLRPVRIVRPAPGPPRFTLERTGTAGTEGEPVQLSYVLRLPFRLFAGPDPFVAPPPLSRLLSLEIPAASDPALRWRPSPSSEASVAGGVAVSLTLTAALERRIEAGEHGAFEVWRARFALLAIRPGRYELGARCRVRVGTGMRTLETGSAPWEVRPALLVPAAARGAAAPRAVTVAALLLPPPPVDLGAPPVRRAVGVWGWTVLLAPPLVWLGAVLLRRLERALARRRAALVQAATWRRLQRAEGAEAAWEAAAALLREVLELPPGEPTVAGLERALVERAVPPAQREIVLSYWRALAGARFGAPGAAPPRAPDLPALLGAGGPERPPDAPRDGLRAALVWLLAAAGLAAAALGWEAARRPPATLGARAAQAVRRVAALERGANEVADPTWRRAAQQAAALWEAGVRRPELAWATAHAWARAHALGDAVLWSRRAVATHPAPAGAQKLLERLRAVARSRGAPPPRSHEAVLSPPVLAWWVFAVAWPLALLCRARGARRRAVVLGALAAVGFVLVLAAAGGHAAGQRGERDEAVLLVRFAPRAAADTDAQRLRPPLPAGTELRVQERRGGWGRIRAGTRRGWVPLRALGVAGSAAVGVGRRR